jgi:serine/threonine-protein kinase ULK/ATG1
MEYCSGGDLSSLIRNKRQLPERTCQRFLQQLGSALRYLRSQNVSHMDLKPQNLLLSSKNNPVLKLAGNLNFLSLKRLYKLLTHYFSEK